MKTLLRKGILKHRGPSTIRGSEPKTRNVKWDTTVPLATENPESHKVVPSGFLYTGRRARTGPKATAIWSMRTGDLIQYFVCETRL